jgi:two-component system, chemotaxis family, response regulator Rcp1
MEFLNRRDAYAGAPRPDLILLDLNLPRKDGREVLSELKSDPDLRTIPVVVLTTSKDDSDIFQAYQLQANCYIAKPVDFEQFVNVLRAIEHFWLEVASLPNKM